MSANEKSEKIVEDLNKSLSTLRKYFEVYKEGKAEKYIYIDVHIEDALGIIQRCIIESEGLENIWKEGMSDYEKVAQLIYRGCTIRVNNRDSANQLNSILVKYVGYHFHNITDTELERLKKLEEVEQAERSKGLI